LETTAYFNNFPVQTLLLTDAKPFFLTTLNTIKMKENWTVVFSAKEVYQVKIAEDILKQNGIESHILNKPDSVIPSIGLAKLYTPNEKAAAAIQVLKDADLKE
jgi:hypothetical protein